MRNDEIMEKMTGGEGWSLSSDEKPGPPKKVNPQSPKPKIRVEKRAGKQVTVIAGLHTYGAERLNAIARELKTTCGAGGTVKNGVIEIQGDKVVVVQAWFEKR
ncbi:MAG: translation initiation factor [Candidatus Omnitrophica bacterium]|nr:translation initiation factor [Candidatus Omnitrophota bacterium]MDD5671596.1 translation initiation factor [Candidatus Omnitrophota bacterium]